MLKINRKRNRYFCWDLCTSIWIIPKGSKYSITELEYQAAISNDIPTLIYIINENTDWPPERYDRNEPRENPKRRPRQPYDWHEPRKMIDLFKAQLREDHIIGNFSNKFQLAAYVAADLGRIFEYERLKDKAVTDPERVYRLINDLKSTNKYDIKRAIDALGGSNEPWLIVQLHQFVNGDDEELANISINALRQLAGHISAAAIADGLQSQLPEIRWWAAYTLGEMSLHGRRNDARLMIDRLIDILQNPSEELGLLAEVVHSISKIGGPKVLQALITILKKDDSPVELKAKALHGPCRFWPDPEYNRFVKIATPIAKQWSSGVKEGVEATNIFRYIERRLQRAVHSYPSKK